MKEYVLIWPRAVTINIQFMKIENGTHIYESETTCFIDELEELIRCLNVDIA